MDNFAEILAGYNPDTPAVAVDFETFYDDGYSVSDMSYWQYTHDPRFDAYMVSIYAPDLGIDFTGPPGDFDWRTLDGMLWLAHNSPFDREVYDALVENAEVDMARPMAWVNTADLAAYKRAPRSLAKAAKVLLGMDLDKTVRDDMKGRVFSQIDPSRREKWLKYAGEDARACYALWDKYRESWPVFEQKLSLHTSQLVKRGVRVDLPALKKDLDVLDKAVRSSEGDIPWAGEQDRTPKGRLRFKKTGEPVLVSPTSPRKLAEYARECGIPMPPTTDAKDERFQRWEVVHGDSFPVVKAVQTWRVCNRLLRIVEQMVSRTRPDGRMEFQLCYFGGHTGRWSGRAGGGASWRDDDESGLNMQNLPKGSRKFNSNYRVVDGDAAHVYEVNLRHRFIAEPGKVFGMTDLSQIEPRVLADLAGDEVFLDGVRSGQSPYEVHARQSMHWTGGPLKKESPRTYAFSKARVLSLGYQAAWEKFISMAAMYVSREDFDAIFTTPVTPQQCDAFLSYLRKYAPASKASAFENSPDSVKCVWVNSWLQVMDYRGSNSKIVAFWRRLQKTFDIACIRQEDLELELPSGRCLHYFKCRKRDKAAETVKGAGRSAFYGGKLAENVTQATSRDVFGEGLLRLEARGYPVVWHVHDEAITEIDPGVTEDELNAALAQPPDWSPRLPVEAETNIAAHYMK